jgi:hypothetical protein
VASTPSAINNQIKNYSSVKTVNLNPIIINQMYNNFSPPSNNITPVFFNNNRK